MDKIPYDQLSDVLASGRSKVVPGSTWQHYKGTRYRVNDIVLIEATNEVAVVYTSLDHHDVSFVRPLNVWLEQVDWNGKGVPRFTQIG